MKCEYKGKDGTCQKPAIMDCIFAEYLDGSSMEYCTLEESKLSKEDYQGLSYSDYKKVVLENRKLKKIIEKMKLS